MPTLALAVVQLSTLISREKPGPRGGREYVSVPDPSSHLSCLTLKHLTEQLSMMCSPDHPSKTISHQFLPSDGILVTCTYKQAPKLALSPSLGQIEGLCKRTPKSSSAVKRDLHGLGWVQTESEKSKANKLTHRHTHASGANIEKQNISDNYKVNKHCGINCVLRENGHMQL